MCSRLRRCRLLGCLSAQGCVSSLLVCFIHYLSRSSPASRPEVPFLDLLLDFLSSELGLSLGALRKVVVLEARAGACCFLLKVLSCVCSWDQQILLGFHLFLQVLILNQAYYIDD